MKTKVEQEQSAFELRAPDCNGSRESITVSYSQLRNAPVGTQWCACVESWGRNITERSALLVYKASDGCAVLHRVWGTTEYPPELVWYNFA